MTLYFAYGSNMDRGAMQGRCLGARPLGVAMAAGWRFFVTTDGYASIVRAGGDEVFGVLWEVGPRDVAALNTYESLDSGLYARKRIAVRLGYAKKPALVYIARATGEGRPRPRYMEMIVEAAQDWELPDDYIKPLRRWLPPASRNAAESEVA
jgi:gamma-glutamylcyclotransferase (GGCT)/AIG2-like uncharacterized protein YtfP